MTGADPAPTFSEPVAATCFSFLRGASHPLEMVARARALGLAGIGIADRNSVAGVVRAHGEWRQPSDAEAADGHSAPQSKGFRLIVGARLVFADGLAATEISWASPDAGAGHGVDPSPAALHGERAAACPTPDIIVYPRNRAGWGALTRLLTLGNARAAKGGCVLYLDDLHNVLADRARAAALALIVMGGEAALLEPLRAAAPHLWLGVTMPRGGRDARALTRAMALSQATGVPLIATNDALYADPACRPLHDVLTAIRLTTPVQAVGRALAPNAERHLKPPAEMARLFRACPQALTATGDLFAAITFTLDDLRYEYPHEPVPPGWSPQEWLEYLVAKGGRARFPQGLPPAYRRTLADEFRLIRLKTYAFYFLTVHDIVAFARGLDPPILCQGRGSAANSLVCFLLGITPIDPVREKLLFSRFLSENRHEPPDIDVDFEHERREEVIQHIYRRYGRDRAGIAATVIHFRQRSALREVGKALALTEDVTARMAATVWGSGGGSRASPGAADDVPFDQGESAQRVLQPGGVPRSSRRPLPQARIAEAGFDPASPEIARLAHLVDQLLEMPRHLSQHVGGFVLSESRLDELVPIHNGAMPGRSFIEWDKDDLTTLGLMKVDVLALGMLTAIRKSFDLMRETGLGNHDLSTVPLDDRPTFAMLQRGDSIGTFQVESRAQINMLPRMKPACLYDLVIQVAIVRPGPIQGGMVHPYLRRRAGEELVEYPGPPENPNELRDVLEKTLGVPLFQEQAMKLAIVAARFTPAQSDGLRRAMATFRNRGIMHHYEAMLIEGMVARGYPRPFAERCFEQIKGFGQYGFPESHAQAFGWLAYVSSWLKCRFPAVFTCALLNSQPMGFYAPAQLVADVQAHGVEVRPIEITASAWDATLEDAGKGALALRLGLRQIDGFRKDWATAIVTARLQGSLATVEDLARRADLPPQALRLLADADALPALSASTRPLTRRRAGWEVRRLPPSPLPLFAAMGVPELGVEPDANLPPMPLAQEVATDYQTHRLSLKGHPMQFLRADFARQGVLTCAQVNAAKDGAAVRCAGVVLVRQRPGEGNAIFITIEDETGIVNALMWARTFEAQRRAVMGARLMLIEGTAQRSKEGVIHLMAVRVTDESAMLRQLTDAPGPGLAAPLASDMNDPAYRPPGQNAPPRAPLHGHPRDVRVLPRSRDFH